jgi:predicted phosphoribosyltransferase
LNVRIDIKQNSFKIQEQRMGWAANVLAESLKDLIKKEKMDSKDMVVLGISRGGVVTADVIAEKLDASFNILIPRKIASPHNELAIGAVMEDGTTNLNDELVRMLNISQQYIDQITSAQIEEIKRRLSFIKKRLLKKIIVLLIIL